MVDDDDLVGKVEHQIALAFRALQLLFHRVELEGEIVAESTVEAEIAVGGTVEQIGDRPQRREDGRHARAIFLGNRATRLPHGQFQAVHGACAEIDLRLARKAIGDQRQQDLAPAVIGFEAHAAPLRGYSERRVDDGRIPARVAPRIFVV